MGIGIRIDVTTGFHPVEGGELVEPVLAQNLPGLFVGPDVERPFRLAGRARLGKAVRILGGIETAFGTGQVVRHIAENIAGHVREGLVAGELVGREIGRGELGLIVEHLLEVGDVPLGIDRVAVEAAAQVIVHAARCHLPQGEEGHGLGDVGVLLGLVRLGGDVEQELEVDRARELRRTAEAAFLGIEHPGVLGEAVADDRKRVPRDTEGLHAHRFHLGLPQRGEEGVGLVLDLLAVRLPEDDDPAQDGDEPGAPRDVRRREVGAADEGFQLRGQPAAHRPAAVAGGGLDEGHVDLIDIGALFPVHLDRDKVFVEEGRDGRRFEGFVLHHMAPVTGGVADGEKNGLVLGLGLGESLLAPRVPVHRIKGVLEKVGGFLPGKAIRGRGRHSPYHTPVPPLGEPPFPQIADFASISGRRGLG